MKQRVMPITHHQYLEMLNRTGASKRASLNEATPSLAEKDLHQQIIEECKNRGWYYVHSRTDKRTTQALGVTDFIIATEDGRTLWIECKREGGKLTPAQAATIHWLERNKQLVAVVYSFQNFLGVCEMRQS